MTGPVAVPDPESLLAHRDFVRAIARSLLYDEHAAEDVVQETWLAAIKAPETVSRGWLATVARNLAVTRIRGDVRRRVREAAAARPEGVPSNAEILARERARRSVVEEVLALPEPYRTTVLLRHLEELSPREVAHRMDVPVETVRTRTRRAIELLRVRLDARHEDDRRGFCLALIAWGAGTSKATGTAAAAGGAFLVGTKLNVAAAVVVVGLATWAAWPHADAPNVAVANAPPPAPPVEKIASERARAHAALSAPAAEAAPAPAPAPEAPPAGPVVNAVPEGEIVGKVLLGKERTPIEGVVVRVMGGNGGPDVAATVPKLAKQTTGQDGTFRFRDVAPGHYLFMAETPSHGARRFEAEIRPGGGAAVDVLFGVGGTIVGRVTTAHGPAVGVTVGLEEAPQTCRTDADGSYRLDDVSGGRHDGYYVHVEAKGDLDGRTAFVTVPPGETRRIDFLADAFLTGVVTLDGAPIAGATVWVAEAAGRPEYRSFKTQAGKDGSYRVSVGAGEAQVTVMAPGRFSVPVQDVTVHAGENRHDIGLGEGDFTERITGRVFVKATGKPVNDYAFHVSLYPADRVPKTPDGRYAVGAGGFTDAHGKFVFGAGATLDAKGRFDCPGLRRGLWRLVVHVYQGQPGHPDLRGADFDVNLLPGLPHEFEIGLEEGPEDPRADGSVSWLSGTVRDAKGGPLPGAFVSAFSANGVQRPKVRADRDGRYMVRRLEPGKWRITVMVMSGGGASTADVGETTIVDGANTLDLRVGGDATGDVGGRVVVKATGEPLAAGDVQLCLVGADDGRFVAATSAEADGRFTFRSVRPGRLRLIATPKVGAVREKALDVDVAAGAKVENLEVALEPMATGKVVFHVKDEEGRPIDLSAQVHFTDVANMASNWGGTSPTGDFEWHYENGRHVVRVWTMKTGPDGKPAIDRETQVTIDVREGETAEVEVMLPPKK